MKFFPLLILTLICLTSLVYAVEMPGLPTIIQGQVFINEKLAPAGTLVSAKIENITIKEYTLTEEGSYILTIASSEGEGKQIFLYVDNVLTNQSFTFTSGNIVEANLNIEKTKSNLIYWIILIILILVILLVVSLKRKKSKGFKNNKH